MAAFLKKNWQKDAGDVAVHAGMRALGGFGSAFIINRFFNGEPADGQNKEQASATAKTMRNIAGPIFTALGVIGDMMIEDTKLRAVCQGIATYSVMHSVAVIAPAVADKVGVSGLGNIPSDAKLLSGVNALGTTAPAQHAIGATSENYTGQYPEEFLLAKGQKMVADTDGKTYNNDWAYLAENIDHADEITKSINGVDDNEAAALMGASSAEEAAALMGMF